MLSGIGEAVTGAPVEEPPAPPPNAENKLPPMGKDFVALDAMLVIPAEPTLAASLRADTAICCQLFCALLMACSVFDASPPALVAAFVAAFTVENISGEASTALDANCQSSLP